MKSFLVTYRDAHDPGCPDFTMRKRGRSATSVDDWFYENMEGEGWKLVRIEELSASGFPVRRRRS